MDAISGCEVNNNGPYNCNTNGECNKAGDYTKEWGLTVQVYDNRGVVPGIPYCGKHIWGVNGFNVAWKDRENPLYINICPLGQNRLYKLSQNMCYRTATLLQSCDDGRVLSEVFGSINKLKLFRGWCCDQHGDNCKVTWPMVDKWWCASPLKRNRDASLDF